MFFDHVALNSRALPQLPRDWLVNPLVEPLRRQLRPVGEACDRTYDGSRGRNIAESGDRK